MDKTVANVTPSTSRIAYVPRTSLTRERERFDLSTRPEEDEELDILILEGLIGQTWNIYAASALFGFQQNDVYLKLYSKKLREELANILSRENVSYNANFSFMEDISSTIHENHLTIKIEVKSITNISEQNVEKSIYQGILLSWKITQITPNIPNSIKLPLLLCRGTRSCIDAVHSVINRMFDCLIIPLPAKEDDLSWLVPITIMSIKGQSVSGEIHMEYIIPELPVTDIITVKFHISDLIDILTAITKNEDNTINTIIKLEHIEMFYQVLHTQMLAMGGLQLGLCTLHRIHLPGMTMMGNKMKVLNTEAMNYILLYLNEKACDTFHTLHIIDV